MIRIPSARTPTSPENGGGQAGAYSPPITIGFLFPGQSQACGPEARALCAKSIGGKRSSPVVPPVLPQNVAGPTGARSGASRDAPTAQSLCSRGKNNLPARPRKRIVPHGFCAQCPCFRAGQALKFNPPNACLANRKGG